MIATENPATENPATDADLIGRTACAVAWAVYLENPQAGNVAAR